MDVILFVKGNAEQARAALDAHGLLTTTALLPLTNMVRCTVHSDDLEKVAAWFCEPCQPGRSRYNGPTNGIGYAPGTCLWYHMSKG